MSRDSGLDKQRPEFTCRIWLSFKINQAHVSTLKSTIQETVLNES